ncbi:agmatinase [Candidatus Saganbacteria bacterium]|nr:agmatinase [Candidatus Saganbacteria bacterium]
MPDFLDILPQYKDYKAAKFIVVPVPHEATTTYGQGTKRGPEAILHASQHLEEFDQELNFETYKKMPVHTTAPCSLNQLSAVIDKILNANKIAAVLGGEHSITPPVVRAYGKKYSQLSVLQLDAHADLRDTFKGSLNNHACVMRRVLEVCPAVQVGVRSLSAEEWDYAQKSGQDRRIHWADRLSVTTQIVEALSSDVYITIDVDVLDPAVVPAVGTPEPGGLFWPQVLTILRNVCAAKNVVGFDVVELSPRRDDIASDFTVAKMVYKLMGYIAAGQISQPQGL